MDWDYDLINILANYRIFTANSLLKVIIMYTRKAKKCKMSRTLKTCLLSFEIKLVIYFTRILFCNMSSLLFMKAELLLNEPCLEEQMCSGRDDAQNCTSKPNQLKSFCRYYTKYHLSTTLYKSKSIIDTIVCYHISS